MASIFCCSDAKPYRPQRLLHEAKFTAFLQWSPSVDTSPTCLEEKQGIPSDDRFLYVVQVVRQVNYGALESKRYFLVKKQDDGPDVFAEISETDIINANFQKLNAYKNFKCDTHNRFFELNLYEKDPVNKHHWRVNLARPAGDIDL